MSAGPREICRCKSRRVRDYAPPVGQDRPYRELSGRRRLSGEQVEGADARSDDGEVPSVERCDVVGAEPLGGSDHGCVDRAEWQVVVARHQLGDAQPVRRRYWFSDQIACSEITDETNFGLDGQPVPSR